MSNPGRVRLIGLQLGFGADYYAVEWVMSSSDLFFNCLQFQISILKSLVCGLCIVLISKC